MNYFSKKEENKSKALKNTEYMEKYFRQQIDESIAKSKIYGGPDRMPERANENAFEPQVYFLNTDSVSAIFATKPLFQGKVAVLNFASYKNPGGMFMEGSSAQEEALCHKSFLYNVLRCFKSYYLWNNQHKNKALYLDRAIYTPDVMFVRNGEAVYCDVITCAAPNFTVAHRYQGIDKNENDKVMRSRICFVRDIAEEQKVDTLILGAYGCGVFGQDPETVAEMLAETFRKTSVNKIIYAVPGRDKNAIVFEKYFQKR